MYLSLNTSYMNSMHSYKDTDIAVIGISGRFPGAEDIGAYWSNLINGKESIRRFTKEELLESGIPSDLINQDNYIKAKGYLDDAECFDSKFFNYTLHEAEIMNPQTRLFHEYVYMALEDAGYSVVRPDNRIGIFAGSSCDDTWRRQVDLKESNNIALRVNNELLINKDFMCSSVAYKLGLKGPCFTINTACSTSLTAVHVACQSLICNDCDMAIAGGVSITFPLKSGYTYEEGMFNSPDGHCCAFDKDSKGTLTGNGVGVVVLKKLSKAIEDKDNIYAVIKGSAINNDGNGKLSYTAPSLEGLESVARSAYEKSRIDLNDVKYIEMHGTGTPLGDAVEIVALKSIFNNQIREKCAIGSVKANIGHLDAAAGIASFIKAVLVIYYKQIPPAINYQSPNEELTIDNSSFYVNKSIVDLQEDSICVGVNSFGQGGSNVHVVLSNFIYDKHIKNTCQEKEQLLLFSAKTKDSLQNYIKSFEKYSKKCGNISLYDISYTLAMTRNHYQYRAYVVAYQSRNLDFSKMVINNVDNRKRRKVILVCSSKHFVNKELIIRYYNDYPSFATYIDDNMGINNILSSDSLTNREEAVILGGIIEVIKAYGILVDGFVGYGVGIIPLMNQLAKTNIENMIKSNSFDCDIERKYKCSYPLYDPTVNEFVLEIDYDAIKTCYQMKTLPDCSGLFDENTIFLHVNTKDFLYVSSNMESSNDGEQFYDHKSSIASVIGELWSKGYSVQVQKLLFDKNASKVSLPHYCFDKIESNLSKTLAKEKNISSYFYELDWVVDKNSLSMPKSVESILIFTDSNHIDSLIKSFKPFVENIIFAEIGENLEKKDNNHYVFNPEKQSDYEYIFYDIRRKKNKIRYIVNLMPLSITVNYNELVNSSLLNLNMYRLRNIVLGLEKYESDSDVVIGNVTQNLYSIDCFNPTNFSSATLPGIQEVICKEYMNISCVHIDFSNVIDIDELFGQRIISEISREEPVKLVVYNQNHRYVQKIREIWGDESKPRILDDNVYVVLGGSGRIGKIVTEYLAQKLNCTIIVTGWSKIEGDHFIDILDDTARDYLDIDLYNKLTEISHLGSKIFISRMDILDKDNTTKFFKAVYNRFGKINGVVNCIGLTGNQYNKLIEDATPDVIKQQLKIREDALLILDSVLEEYDYDFCIVFSSIAAILGGLGQFGYAAACSFMNQFVKARNSMKSKKWDVICLDTLVTDSSNEKAYHLVPRQTVDNMLHYIFQNKNNYEYIVTFTPIQNYIKNNKSLTEKYRSRNDINSVNDVNRIEDAVLTIWSSIFGRKVEQNENFFEIGGDSLKALGIISSIHSELDVRLKMKDVYTCQTIKKMVELLKQKCKSVTFKMDSSDEYKQQAYYECSFAQKEMFWSSNNIYPTRFNLTCIYMIDGELELEKLNIALNKLIKRHEIYRTCFVLHNGTYRQKIIDHVEIKIKHLYSDDIDRDIEEFITEFDVSVAPLLRMQLVTDNKSGKQYLFTDMHHAIFDNESVQLFFDELMLLYSDNSVNENVIQFKEFSSEQLALFKSGKYKEYQEFWMQRYSDYKYTKLTPDNNSASNSFKRIQYELVDELKYKMFSNVALGRNMSLSSLILAVWMLTISYLESQDKVSVGLRITQRFSKYQSTMGCFLEKVLLITKVDRDVSLDEYLRKFDIEYNQMLENSFYPFYLLNQDYKKDKLFSIIFNYMVIDSNTASTDAKKLVPYKYEPKEPNSKYDFNIKIFDFKKKITCSMKYKNSSYSEKYIEKMFKLYNMIAENILIKTDISIEDLFNKKVGEIKID